MPLFCSKANIFYTTGPYSSSSLVFGRQAQTSEVVKTVLIELITIKLERKYLTRRILRGRLGGSKSAKLIENRAVKPLIRGSLF